MVLGGARRIAASRATTVVIRIFWFEDHLGPPESVPGWNRQSGDPILAVVRSTTSTVPAVYNFFAVFEFRVGFRRGRIGIVARSSPVGTPTMVGWDDQSGSTFGGEEIA